METLRKVPGYIPWACYLVCLIEFAERGSYYGVTGSLSNFIQFSLPEGGNGAGATKVGTQETPGALGLGLQTASALTLLLTFLAYVFPLLGGILADVVFGRYKTIWIGVYFDIIGHILLVISAIPSVISGGHAVVPLAIAIIVIALGTGLIKPNLLPLLLDQYTEENDVVKVLETGEKVVVSRQVTQQRATLIFYWAINVGAFLAVATSYCEKRVGFWLAFFIPLVVFMVMPVVLIILSKRMIKCKPQGTILIDSWKVIKVTFRKGWYGRWKRGELWYHARPSEMQKRGELTYTKKSPAITWSDVFVIDVKETFNACKIVYLFPIFFINDGGIGSIQTSQASSLTTNGVPNDLISNFNPLMIIVFCPLLDYVIYPSLRKIHINPRPAILITLGFIICACSGVAGAVIQYYVYQTSPCGYYATDCDIGTGVSPISVWVETILYILSAAGECFALTTAYELAYSRAPESMKGLVFAILLFMNAISAAIGEACIPALNDPNLIWPFVGPAIAGFISAAAFYYMFRNLHIDMEQEKQEKRRLREEDEAEKVKDVDHDAKTYLVTSTPAESHSSNASNSEANK